MLHTCTQVGSCDGEVDGLEGQANEPAKKTVKAELNCIIFRLGSRSKGINRRILVVLVER